MFNTFAGFTRDDDWLPPRFYSEPLDMEGRSVVCSRQAFEQLHHEYYEAMGWNEEGVPKKETLEKLELSRILGQYMEKDKNRVTTKITKSTKKSKEGC